MRRPVRSIIASLLLLAHAVTSLVGSHGSVVCYEPNGTQRIETRFESEDCHTRQGLHEEDQSCPPGVSLVKSEGCVDVPLAAGTAISPTHTTKFPDLKPLLVPVLFAPLVADTQTTKALALPHLEDGHSPPMPSPALAGLRTVIILV